MEVLRQSLMIREYGAFVENKSGMRKLRPRATSTTTDRTWSRRILGLNPDPLDKSATVANVAGQ